MAQGDRLYVNPGNVTEWHSAFPLILRYAIINNLDPAVPYYVQFFDTNAAPPPATPALVTIVSYPLFSMIYRPTMLGRLFATGLAIAISSTPDIYTPLGGTLLNFSLECRQP